MQSSDFKSFGDWLNKVLAPYNYHVAPTAPAGKPGKNVKSMREYRLQLINKHNDTSQKLIEELDKILKDKSNRFTSVEFNQVSPNSSKFPSYSFLNGNQKIDLVIARGANRGENFETMTIANLAKVFSLHSKDDKYSDLISKMNSENAQFASVEIKSVKQRTGSTKKEGVSIERLGAIIGDIVLLDSTGKDWYISLKDINGNTFSSYSGASSLFDSNGTLQPKSVGAEFLEAFGVDLNKVQAGFDERNKKPHLRQHIPVKKSNPTKMKAIFERAWGMNYFYVRRTASGWKVFWLDREKLNKLTSNLRVTDIKYPSKSSKQITILCKNNEEEYLIELRNSKAGEYPNDIKIKTKK